MLFGTIKHAKKLNYIAIIGLLISTAVSCKDKKSTATNQITLNPVSGTSYKSGDDLKLSVKLNGLNIDSIQYFVDDSLITTAKDSAEVAVNSNTLALGSRTILAKIYAEGNSQEISSNIILLAAKSPTYLDYKVVNTYSHDITSYTQGLEFHDGIFYESDGEYGASSLRKVDVEGKVLKQLDLEPKYFAEGITIVGDKILQLTYQERVMLEYDKNTFELLRTIPYNHANEGWGLAFDGQTIYNTDGSNKIFKLNKDTYQVEGAIEVYDDKGAVPYLNELEWIDGKIYANIYTSDLIAIINPKTGAVESYINLMGIRKESVEDESQDVLNGIAWDAKGKRLFVTGKKWPKLYQIEIFKK